MSFFELLRDLKFDVSTLWNKRKNADSKNARFAIALPKREAR